MPRGQRKKASKQKGNDIITHSINTLKITHIKNFLKNKIKREAQEREYIYISIYIYI